MWEIMLQKWKKNIFTDNNNKKAFKYISNSN